MGRLLDLVGIEEGQRLSKIVLVLVRAGSLRSNREGRRRRGKGSGGFAERKCRCYGARDPPARGWASTR
jgi:hypothetical protein